jgi:hypothetical protein
MKGAGCRGAACAGQRSKAAQQRSEHGRKAQLSCAGAEGRPAPWTQAHRLGVSRRQPQNEDLSDCAEGCPSARQPVFILAIGHQ